MRYLMKQRTELVLKPGLVFCLRLATRNLVQLFQDEQNRFHQDIELASHDCSLLIWGEELVALQLLHFCLKLGHLSIQIREIVQHRPTRSSQKYEIHAEKNSIVPGFKMKRSKYTNPSQASSHSNVIRLNSRTNVSTSATWSRGSRNWMR